jgi:hypothetical protein
MAVTLTTELEAINTMLSVVGQAPVNALPSTSSSNSPIDAVVAETVLDETNRSVQLEGWWFNTEEDLEIAPDVNSNIIPPLNTLRIDPNEEYQYKNFVFRGGKLYDANDNTFAITDTIKYNIVLGLDFTDLPESARRYIVIRATRLFQDRVMASDTLHAYTQEDELRARAECERSHNRNGDFNFNDDSLGIDMVHRRY